MFPKKKTYTVTSPEKLTTKTHLRNKNHQKQHSRYRSMDCPEFDISSLVLSQFRQSSRQIAQQQNISNIDSLLLGKNGSLEQISTFAINTKQITFYYCSKQLISNYYIFSKNQQLGRNRPTIQNKLVQSIRNRISKQVNKPFPHFQSHIYPIVRKYMYKRKRLTKKQEYQGELQVPESHKVMVKELPTASSEYSMVKQTYPALKQRICRSESFQLKALTECIKQIFSKQNQQKSLLGVNINYDNIQFGPFQIQTKRQFIECDFSSIEANSRFDLQLQPKDKIREDQMSTQSNYGLQELRIKYQNMRLSQITQHEQRPKHIGHKRNPTDVAFQKKIDFYGDPMTPKDNAGRSEFCSSSKIPFQPFATIKKKTPKSKQKDFYEPYMLKFDKKKTEQREVEFRGPLKQNLKSSRKKSKKEMIRSRSKSSKKSAFDPFKKKLQTQS